MRPTKRIISGLMLVAATAVQAADYQAPLAITGAFIHDAQRSEPVEGTILIIDGRIRDAGADVAIPAGTEVLDGAGLHAYPAFIDAHSAFGIPDVTRTVAERRHVEDENPDVTQGPLAETRAANRRGIHPEFRALDVFAPADQDRAAYHKQGFATALVAPRGGIFAGASCLTNITDVPARRAILAEDVAQHASFDPAEPGDYPATVLGVSAALRQFCLDVRWYGEFARYLERHPRSDRRLPADAALATMHAFFRSGRPLIFEANTEVEIIRALDLADELNLRVWISGAREAYKVRERLTAGHVPLIVSLALGEEPADETRYEPPRLRQERRRQWEEQVANFRTMLDAGSSVAVSSRGVEGPDELMKNLRRAIDAGLTPQAALAALTINPARMFGEADRLGRIAPGYLANVVLMTAPFVDQNARVRFMFVEGRRFAYDVKEKPSKADADTNGPGAATPATEDEAAADLPEPAWRVELEEDRRPHIHTGGSVLISGATILPVSSDPIPNGTILVRDGKIVEIGANIARPAGVPVIEADGLVVMPGIVDAHSHMALDAVNEGTLSVTAEVRVGDALNHRPVAIYRALAGGVTTIHAMHGSANTIGGENVVLKLRYGASPAAMRFAGAPRTLKFALGENVTQAHRTDEAGTRFPNSRMGVESVLRQALVAAGEYRTAQQAFAARQAAGVDLPPLRRDLRLASLAAVLDGDMGVHAHGYRADECLRLFAVAEDFGFRIAVLHHALESYRIAPEIARHGCGVSTFADNWAYKLEAYTGIPYNAAVLTRRGINVSVHSDSRSTIRFLNLEAAKCMRWGGLGENEALALVTLRPAEQLGIADRVGSLEPGKDADLAIFNGPPLDSFSKCVMTLIDGEVYFQHPLPQRGAPATQIVRAPQQRTPVPEGPYALYAIVNGIVHTVSGPVIPQGTVLIRNERLDDVGADVTIPPGAVIVDAEGAHVYPGLIDAGSVLGLAEILGAPPTRDDRDIARMQPELRAAAAIHAASAHIRVARQTGITTAVARPLGGWIAGQSAILDLNGWSAPEMLYADDFALHMQVPSLPVQIPKAERAQRMREHARQLAELEDFFRRATHYAAVMQTGADERPPRDLRLEAMAPYVRGEKPVVFAANSYKEIIESVAFAKKHKLRGIIGGGREAWKCAAYLARENVPVILETVRSYPDGDFEPFDSVLAGAAELDRAGAAYCFASASAAGANDLPIQVGIAVANGLNPERALRALTLGAAEILGIDGEVGSLESGKRANVIVCSASPLQVQAGVTHMFIKGQPVDLGSIQTENLEKYRHRPDPVLPPPRALRGPPSLTRP